MFSSLNFLLGLLSGILATLIAGNPYLRFRMEKSIRRTLRKPLVSASLRTFPIYCKGGILFLHCIELKNAMWLTSVIPKVYFLSYGPWAYDSHAYKPFIYFRSRGLSTVQLDVTPTQLFQEYSDNVIPYTPDNPSLSMNISKSVPLRVVVICELIEWVNRNEEEALNHIKIVGKLHAGVANPMPVVSPGAKWGMTIISEDFGIADNINVGVPANLEEQEPLGDSSYVLQMKERPPCLMDVSYHNLTWPLRLEIKDNRFKTPQKYWRLNTRWGMAKQVKIRESK
jgi:hypothetical protein